MAQRSEGRHEPRAMEAPVESGPPEPVGTGGERTLLPYGVTLSSSMAVLHPERTLEFLGFDHLAIRVADVRRAESFYHEFFERDVVLRARRFEDNWEVMPSTFDYTEGLTSGYYPEVVQLRNGALALVLINAGRGAVLAEPRLGHVGLRVPPDTLTALRGIALVRNFAVEEDARTAFRFTDPYGITWHLTTGHEAEAGASS